MKLCKGNSECTISSEGELLDYIAKLSNEEYLAGSGLGTIVHREHLDAGSVLHASIVHYIIIHTASIPF